MASVTFGNGQRWELGEQIGAGGAGQVYLATNGASEPHVVKLVPKGVPGAQREIFVNRGLQSRTNVVPVLDTGKTDTHLALLMPKAQMSLRQYMGRTPGPMSEADALPILTDIARGLVSLGGAQVPGEAAPGIVHRDLKPENVLFLNGAWCISDFGIARYLSKGTALDTRRYFMTHAYAAPEQWRGETATPETDVYALGVIAFEVLMGRLPFEGPDFRQQHLDGKAPPLTGVSPFLAGIITECLYRVAGSRPLPDLLLRRLESSAVRPGPIRDSMTVLHTANLTEAGRLGEAGRSEDAERERTRQHADLLDIAVHQWQNISHALRETILDHAPSCRLIRDDGPGWDDELDPMRTGNREWKLQLGPASIGLSKLREQREATRLPFDVIAYGAIRLHFYAGPLEDKRRTHSLWFCDATSEGRYLWHETAFVASRPTTTDTFIANGGMETNIELSRALSPASDEALAAVLWDDVHPGRFKVGWPLTPIVMGDLDELVGRWATWFGQARQGHMPPVSATPVSGSSGSRRPSTSKSRETAARAQRNRDRMHSEQVREKSVSIPEVTSILRELGYGSGYDDGFGGVNAVAVAPHLPLIDREAICRELRSRLKVQPSAALVFRRQADKKYRGSTTSSGLAGSITARFSPLRLLDGTRYEEFTYVSNQDRRIVLVERREPPKQGGNGRLLYAFVVMVSEADGALQRGRPSPSLQAWFSEPEMIAPPAGSMSMTPYRPYTAERAHAAFEALMDPPTERPELSGVMPLSEVELAPGAQEWAIDFNNLPKPPVKRKSMRRPGEPRDSRSPDG